MQGLNLFFFQAEDGIRDRTVTGVQTCALPIFVAPCQSRGRFGEAGKARRRGIVGAIPRRSNAASVVETPPNLVTDFGFGTLAGWRQTNRGAAAVQLPPPGLCHGSGRGVATFLARSRCVSVEEGSARR